MDRRKLSKSIVESVDIEMINICQDDFEEALEAGNFDGAHWYRQERDRRVQRYEDTHGRLPRQDANLKHWH